MPATAIELRAKRGQPLGMPPARFLRDYWQKRPLLIRGAFPDFTPPLSPDDLAGLACMDGALARIVLHHGGKAKSLDDSPHPRLALRAIGSADVRSGILPAQSGFRAARGPGMTKKNTSCAGSAANDGKWEVRTGPFDDATFAKLPDSNWTLLVQDVDKWDADTAALLDHFPFIPSWRIDDVMISYAVDGGGVGAHVDQYDVFLVQGLGQRRWAIDTRPNPPTDFRDDVELKLLKVFSPTHEWVLEPGDVLYLPPGVPHDGVAIGECMTFSVGMRAPSAAEMLTDFAHALAEQLPEERRYADPDLQAVRETGEIDDAAVARAMRAMPWLRVDAESNRQKREGDHDGFARSVPASTLRTWFGCFITRYRIAQVPVPRKRPVDRSLLAHKLPHSVLERDPWSRFAWCRNGRDASLFVDGHVHAAPLAWARALSARTRAFDGGALAKLPQRARGVALLADLIDAGHLHLRKR
ncbi:MAG: hypothetical protein OJF55_000287 [Rhodanobacteraceae bacterium]|nr:MAG: hypothetical protein OJF55_000287 [Rhodanobacteraceae bacterium]